ncbi:LLM class flavin-dependent oxidoreductase [Pseudonocardia endophytica]|uniref:Alkanesulfonate monooxygenase SsuD/methylene tetrahydromethanopterin reductase-like flavin-dependent oxidoreductase (Luciferase family) n=1 Tax=Pseudonocardia endophytica TaxID=401976 RepID=A0A4R1HLY1_PSEEN|nr:LLM class flavin-dependent oxidoreductase [Pseudonocardia endophytica]TCK21535.1 alkanesulfonate monooxygenase SsuD/methylene tetrahydromethanopterin reductase-like flavin-dependent oxidoreductase (luciferase family) [Pseudonocardia endophytica]
MAECGYGVMIPTFDPFRAGSIPLLAGAALAEELGFDSGWVGDHLSFHPPLLDALGALSGAAGCTRRIALGTGVLLLPMRHPVWTAKQVSTLDALAPGRVLLGVGVGGENPQEWEAAGVPVAQRGARLDESLDIVTALLRGEAVDHRGPLLPTRSPALEPAPSAVPPIVVGGRSDAALRRAARVGDAWMGVWMSARRAGEVGERLGEFAADAGRPVPSRLMMLFVHVGDGAGDDSAARDEAAAFVGGQYGLPFDALERWALVGGEQQVADGLNALADAGVSGVILVPAARDVLEQYRRLAALRPSTRWAGGPVPA